MLLRTATQASIFVTLAFPLTGVSAAAFQDDIETKAPTANVPRNIVWTNTSNTPPEATVEIQFDGLVGSGVINLTSNAGFTIVDLTTASACNTSGATCVSPNPFATNSTSGATAPILPTNGVPATTTTSANVTQFTSDEQCTSSPPPPSSTATTGKDSFGPNQSTTLGLSSATGTSANISVFTGVGERSTISAATILIWLLLALVPTLFVWSEEF